MLKIPEAIYKDVINHCREEKPIEACGVLSGESNNDERIVEKLYRANNELKSKNRFQIDPDELVDIYRSIDEEDLEVVGIYHSHPAEPKPSKIDEKKAVYPDVSYLIISIPSFEYDSYYLTEDREFREEEVKIL